MFNTRVRVPALAGFAGLLAACADAPTAPSPELAPVQLSSVVAAACETITFDEFGHGDYITTVSALGLNLTVTGFPYVQPSGAANLNATPRAFDTDVSAATVEDDDLAADGICTACAGLGRLLVLDDERNTPANFFWGDYRWGGVVRLSGFAGGDYYVEEFTYVDNNLSQHAGEPDEPPVTMRVDGTTDIGSTVPGADGNVQTIVTANTPFSSMIELRMGTALIDQVTGSGGVDDIRICRVPTGFGVRTPGYWMQPHHAWPVATITIGGIVYSRTDAQALMKAPGAGDKTYDMFAQLVAAKLNVISGASAGCIQDVIDDADTWMTTYPVGSGVKANHDAWKTPVLGLAAAAGTMHTTLDSYNNGLMCAASGG
jgi:hypothetical protein